MIKLLSHLSHIEITAPDVEKSAKWYEEQIGMRVFARDAGTVYLRSWGDYYTYSLAISEGPEVSLAVAAWRTTSPEALEELGKRVEAAGVTGTWADSGFGHGRSYTFTGPWGHTFQFYWEVDKYKGEGEFASVYPDRPSRRTGHGIAPRQLDHLTIAASDVKAFCEWHRDIFGFRIMAYTSLDEVPDLTVFGVLTTNEKSHDLGVVLDSATRGGRINHFAYWVDTREELLVAADLLLENGTAIENGPSIHGIGEQSYLYFRDPSGMRIELNTGGYRNYVPDWEPYDWKPSQGANNMYKNGTFPASMTESFPPDLGSPTATEEGVHPDTLKKLIDSYDKQG